MSFPGSRIVWEYYPGQGIEIQWLATFGEANGYYLSGHENANLRQLLGEVIPLATQRAGGHRVGVPVQLRRRRAAVDERPLAGHGAAGARARVRALQGTGVPGGRAAGARHLPDAAAAGRAREHTRGRDVRRVLLRARATGSSTASSRRSSASTTTRRSPRTRSGWRCSKPATRRRARGAATTTRAPGRCMTSSANRTSTTTNCSPNSSSTYANARARAAAPRPSPPRRRTGGPAPRRRRAPATTAAPGTRSGRSDLLHDAAALHADSHAAGDLAADEDAARRHARRACSWRCRRSRRVALTVRQGSRWCGPTPRPSNAASRGCCGSRRRSGGSFSVTLTATDLAGNFSTQRDDRRHRH